MSIVLAADRDDDDANGVPDGEQNDLPPAARVDLVPLDRELIGATLHPITGGDRLRLVANGKPLAWSTPAPAGTMVQGLAPGAASIVAVRAGVQTSLVVHVVGVSMRDGERATVDLARSHASLERTPPSRILGGADSRYEDPDALRVVLEVPDDLAARDPPTDTLLASITPSGETIDVLRVALSPVPCTPAGAPVPGTGVTCAASAPIRFVIDEVDQKHPLVIDRSLRAEVGGAIAVVRGGRKVQAIRVLGPRATSVGPIGRLRATLRPTVLRVAPGGGPAIGGSDSGAVALLRGELALASAIWGQCGITFGPAPDVRIVDPPPAHLLSLGDDLGLPATGGELRFRVDGHDVVVPLAHGATPGRVADDVARALEHVGLTAVVSPNSRIAPGASGSVDVSVRRRDGRLVAFEPSASGAPLSSDATFVAAVGSVDLSDGLQHFGDMDSVAGTIEERTLLKAVDDGDPRTVEVLVVPLFAGGGRIGESFIASDLSSVRNAVILDRAGIRARRSSLTLAHELGHVLMDLPGHPDDYGVDTPTQLMDSDGSDASPFGPRRLTLEECARVVRQAGPKARTPLLADWPIGPIHYEEKIVPR
ncbi:MAG: hypothetical protein ACLQVI_34845 [Polyangiaceae bacterium]